MKENFLRKSEGHWSNFKKGKGERLKGLKRVPKKFFVEKTATNPIEGEEASRKKGKRAKTRKK